MDQRNFLTWHIVLYTIVGDYDNITHPAQENIFNINIIKLPNNNLVESYTHVSNNFRVIKGYKEPLI